MSSAVEQDRTLDARTGNYFVHAVESAQDRRLSAAGRTDERGHAPGRDGQAHIGDSVKLAVVDVDVLEIQTLGHYRLPTELLTLLSTNMFRGRITYF